MSEEQNDMAEDNKKSKAALREEMRELRDELTAVRQAQQESNNTVKGEDGSHERIQDLENELEDLKREMRERSVTVEPAAATEADQIQTVGAPLIHQEGDGDDFIMVDAEEEDIVEEPPVLANERAILRDTTHLHVGVARSDAASQTSTTDSNAENDAFREARLSLERLFPGEITLGLKTRDPQPLLKTMVERLQTLKAQVLISNDSLRISKTSENNLRSQFNAMLEQLNRARNYSDEVAEERDCNKERALEAQEEAQELRQDLTKLTSESQTLQKDLGDSELSIQKLQDALEGYRADVSRLEMLITNMETEHKAALKKFQEDMDEAVADLDCQVAAEAVGRRAAEG